MSQHLNEEHRGMDERCRIILDIATEDYYNITEVWNHFSADAAVAGLDASLEALAQLLGEMHQAGLIRLFFAEFEDPALDTLRPVPEGEIDGLLAEPDGWPLVRFESGEYYAPPGPNLLLTATEAGVRLYFGQG